MVSLQDLAVAPVILLIVRVLLTTVVYLASLAVLAPLLFFAVMILAGPHSSLLPSRLQPAVLVLGWIAWIVLPVLIARTVWRRGAQKKSPAPETL